MADFTCVADFNNDGDSDIAVSSYGASSISILLGDGHGEFVLASEIVLASAPDFVTAGDMNADGDMDLVTASYDGSSVSVLIGNGDGTFASAVDYAAGTGPRAVVLGDFTGDGKLDVVVARSFAKTLTIMKNSGSGTLMTPVNSSLSFVPNDLTTADFNSDGKLDLAAVDFFGNKAAILLGVGNGTFQSATTYTTGSGPASVFAADVNADGTPDLLTANLDVGTVSMLLGNSNGTLQSATSITAGSGATFVTSADLDSDGNLDILTVDSNADTISVIWGAGSGTFYPAIPYSTASLPRSLSVGSFDGVGGLDLVVANQGINSATVFIGGAVTAPDPIADPGGPYSVSEGASIPLNGSQSVGSSLTYAWDLDGDNLFGEIGAGASRGAETGPTPTFSAAGLDGNGSFNARLRVTDINGVKVTSTFAISINNVPPTLSISGSSSAIEGASYTLSLSESDPGSETISQWTINWGDGTTQTITGNPASAAHAFVDNGLYTISATATDEDGTYSAGNTKVVSIINAAPSLSIAGPNTIAVNTPYTLSLGSSDPGDDTITQWTINWGDGASQTIAGSPASATHVFTGNSFIASVTATATDEDGSYASNSKTVGVRGIAPLAHAGGPYSVNEEGSVTLDGSATLGIGELAYEWDLDGDGIFGEEGAGALRGDEIGINPTFSATGLNGPGSFEVALRVTNVDEFSDTSAATIQIVNVAPVLTLGGAATVATGAPYTLSLSAAYVGLDSITSWSINWGDGTSQTVSGSALSATKTYSSAGTRSITATATDADGTYAAAGKTITVAPPTPPDTIGNGTSTAKNLGGLKATSVKATEEYIGPSDRNDYFKFSTSSVLKIDAKLYNLTDNADLMLLNAAGTRLAYAKHTGTTIERFTVTLQPGTYYLRALSTGASETPYRLRVEAIAVAPPTSTPSGLNSAKDLGAIVPGGVKSVNDSVATGNTTDLFRFTISASRAMSLKLTGLTQNANLELLDSTGKAIRSSARAGTSDESIASTLVTGTYYAKVTFAGTSTASYRLRVAAA